MKRLTSTLDSLLGLERYSFNSVDEYLAIRDNPDLKYGYLGQEIYFPYDVAMTFMPQKILNQNGEILGYDITCGGISDPAETQSYEVLPVTFSLDFLADNKIFPKGDSNPFVSRLNRLVLFRRECEFESVIKRQDEFNVGGGTPLTSNWLPSFPRNLKLI